MALTTEMPAITYPIWTYVEPVYPLFADFCSRGPPAAPGQLWWKLKIIASIEEPQLIAKILSHLERTAPEQSQSELPLWAWGPPAQSRLL